MLDEDNFVFFLSAFLELEHVDCEIELWNGNTKEFAWWKKKTERTLGVETGNVKKSHPKTWKIYGKH